MLEGISWLREHSEAYCVTFAQGVGETELLRRFGGNLSQAQWVQPDDWNAREELQLFGEVVQVGQCDGWAFAYEENGFRGTLPEVLQSTSAGTVVVSVFCNVNMHTQFCYVEDGATIVNCDPIGLPYEGYPVDVDAMPRVLALFRQAGLSVELIEEEVYDYDFVGAMFALAEAAGARLSKEAISEKPLLCSFIRNPFSDFVEDLLTQGGNEQTVNRFLALLSTTTDRERLLHLLDDTWQGHMSYITALRKPHSEQMRSVADRVLSILHSVQIIPHLLEMLDKDNQAWRSVASIVLNALIRFDQMHDEEGARERLLALSSAREPELAWHAALALGRLGDQRAVEPLLHLFSLYRHGRLPFYSHEREAVHLLGQLRASSAVETLLNLLNPRSESVDFQRELFKVLEQIEGDRIVERMMPLLDPKPETRTESSFQFLYRFRG